jgi:hypothetical protein
MYRQWRCSSGDLNSPTVSPRFLLARTGRSAGSCSSPVPATSDRPCVFHRAVVDVHPAAQALSVIHRDRPRPAKEQAGISLLRFEPLVVVQGSQGTLVARQLEDFPLNHRTRLLTQDRPGIFSKIVQAPLDRCWPHRPKPPDGRGNLRRCVPRRKCSVDK